MTDLKQLELERDELTAALKAKQAQVNAKRKEQKTQAVMEKRYKNSVKANNKLRAQRQILSVRVYDELKELGLNDTKIKLVLGLHQSKTLSVVIDEWREINKGDKQ